MEVLEPRRMMAYAPSAGLSDAPPEVYAGVSATADIEASGAVATVDAPIETVLDVRAFGAVLNGVVDDAPAIQAAIDALPSAGGTVLIPGLAGIGASGVSIHLSSNVTLAGWGAGAGFKSLAVSQLLVGSFDATMLRVSDSFDITVKDLFIDGNRVANTLIGVQRSHRVIVRDNTLSNVQSPLAAIGASGNWNSKYINNTITDTHGVSRGMWIGSTNVGAVEWNPLIQGNNISNSAATGLALVANGADVIGNTIINSNGAGIAISGDLTGSAANLYIESNVIRGNVHGIQGDSVSDAVLIDQVEIVNNTVEGNRATGIYAVRVKNWTMSGNWIRNNNIDNIGTGHGIYLDRAIGCVVTANHCYDTRNGAARTQDSGIAAIAYGLPLTIEDLQIFDNDVFNNGSHGIMVANAYGGTADGIEMGGNASYGNGGWGIVLAEEASGQVQNLVVAPNSLFSNALGNLKMTVMPEIPGDFNYDQVLNAADADLMNFELTAAGGADDRMFDLNGDNLITPADLQFHVTNILNTQFGDTDVDGDVDLTDLGTLATNYGRPNVTWEDGDFDGDGDVDLIDLGQLATNYGAGNA